MNRMRVTLALCAIWLMLAPAVNCCVSTTTPSNFSGCPWYAEELTSGSPVSDFGSHYGIKYHVSDNKLLYMVYYSCGTGPFGKIDRSYLELAGIGEQGYRRVNFDSFGWRENVLYTNAEVTTYVFFIDTDLALVTVTVKNTGKDPLTCTPTISLVRNGEFPGCDGNCIITKDFTPAWFNSKVPTHRVLRPSFEINRTYASRLPDGYVYKIVGKDIAIRDNTTMFLVISFAPEKNRALSRAKTEIMPERQFELMKNDWNTFFTSLPPLPSDDPELYKLYHLSATALRMNLYAPRGNMTSWCSVPSKGVFNYFWGWDTPFQALGISEWDPDMAEQLMCTQFEGQLEDGMLRHMIGESLKPVLDITQPPVQGWCITDIYLRDPDRARARAWLNEMYDDGDRYMKWWAVNRDSNGNGLFEYTCGDETGWDDTPRYYPRFEDMVAGTRIRVEGVDAVDLNCWLYLYYRELARWAAELGNETGVNRWNNEASKLGDLIDDMMWDEQIGAWTDLKYNQTCGRYDHIDVLTPAIWFPAFVGASDNLTRVRKVIEDHLLDEHEFFGKYPIPSVAYNSDYYNHDGAGYYWRGQIWLILAYTALPTLYKYGYDAQCRQLAWRLCDMIKNKGGIYENYNAENGEVGECGCGYEQRACFQFGWSSTFTAEMLLRRYERVRYVFNDTTQFDGYVKHAIVLEDEKIFYSIDSDEYNVPHVHIASNKPLLATDKFTITLTDPYDMVSNKKVTITLGNYTFSVEVGKSYRFNALDGSLSILT